ncbi:MAG: four-carbon acid sugar kinase family protein [Ardenticatenaceae bacterium]
MMIKIPNPKSSAPPRGHPGRIQNSLVGVVADDITGANDIGIMFAKAGLVTHVYSYKSVYSLAGEVGVEEADVCILDTDSRYDTPQVAYEKVFAATRELQRAGSARFFNKTCSVFRGNIGPEFDAMLDALDEQFAVVVLGFPKNGRTTVDGIHYVHGKLLEESEFRQDPMHPMTCSNLVEILQSQTRRKVALLTHEVIERGPDTLHERIEQLHEQCNYLILDVPDQPALRTIAEAVQACKVLCGSSALAEELPAFWGVQRSSWGITIAPQKGDALASDEIMLPDPSDAGVLCVAGSLMPQTGAQIAYLRGRGVPTWQLDSARLFDPTARKEETSRLVAEIAPRLRQGEDVLLHTANDPLSVQKTHDAGAGKGLEKAAVSRLVSSTLADLTSSLCAEADVNRLVIAGGDTSAAICDRLGITGMRIWQEIQPGLPSCVSLTDPPMLLVLKSGSFGTLDFLEQAIQHVRRETEMEDSYYE